MSEVDRIRLEFARRAREIPDDYYALTKIANLFLYQQRARNAVRALTAFGLLPITGKRILEVGCGTGGWLPDFELWGAKRSNLAGIDLLPERIDAARKRLGVDGLSVGDSSCATGPDLRVGDASKLPWSTGQFDLVVQSTVFTSILDAELKAAVAAEMLRVLKPDGGAILWYDFSFDNPRNPQVRGVGRREIRRLFPGCNIWLSRSTLAPPIARHLVPRSWIVALLFEQLRALNTHYLGIIRRPAGHSGVHRRAQ